MIEKRTADNGGSPFDKFTLQLLKDGQPVGVAFEINRLTFDKTYKAKTAKPEGSAEVSEAKYIVKKKPAPRKKLKLKTK